MKTMTRAQEKQIHRLIQVVQDTSFACGDYNGEGDTPYRVYFEASQKAAAELFQAIENMKGGA